MTCELLFKNIRFYDDLYARCKCLDLVGWLDALPGGCFAWWRRLLSRSFMWCHGPCGATWGPCGATRPVAPRGLGGLGWYLTTGD